MCRATGKLKKGNPCPMCKGNGYTGVQRNPGETVAAFKRRMHTTIEIKGHEEVIGAEEEEEEEEQPGAANPPKYYRAWYVNLDGHPTDDGPFPSEREARACLTKLEPSAKRLGLPLRVQSKALAEGSLDRPEERGFSELRWEEEKNPRRRKRRRNRQLNGTPPRRRRNSPASDAAAQRAHYEKLHWGDPPTGPIEVDAPDYRDASAVLGKLVKVEYVASKSGKTYTWVHKHLTPPYLVVTKQGKLLIAEPKGKKCYIVTAAGIEG